MGKPKVLIVHVPYQNRGGEDIHVETLSRAYQEMGYTVEFLPQDRRPPARFGMAALRSLIPIAIAAEDYGMENSRPDLVHLHNIFPILGPRFLAWLRRKKIPTLMTVHNHRFFCTNGLALRENRTCKACFSSRVPWRAVVYRCNQDWAKTLYHFLALSILRTSRLLAKTVDVFVAPSAYIAGELKRIGIPSGQIETIVHPVAIAQAVLAPDIKKKSYLFDVVFAGRLSPEKGIHLLLTSIRQSPELKFAIVGDGALTAEVQSAAKACPNLTYFPNQSHAEAISIVQASRIGVLPSLCNEILSLFALEIFALGKRCVVFDTESMRWFENLSLPLHFARSGDAADLRRKMKEALGQPDPSELETKRIRDWLSLHRFRNELKTLISRIQDRERVQNL